MSSLAPISIFLPEMQKTVWDVQTEVRKIDMSLYPSVRALLKDGDQTFVYSTLAGWCAFIDSNKLQKFSPEISDFSKNIVMDVVGGCFQEIGKFKNDLGDQKLKLALMKQIDRLQFHPKKVDFTTIENVAVIEKLEKIVETAKYTLYKLDAKSEKYYGGRIDIEQDEFAQMATVLQQGGYKKEGDIIGSSFDLKGHITTIEPRELAQNYESTIANHKQFISSMGEDVSLSPVSLKIGAPQSGRMSRIVAINVKADNINQYRKACGLDLMRFAPHISVFSQEIQPIESLKATTITDFTRNNGSLSKQLNACFMAYKPKEQNTLTEEKKEIKTTNKIENK